MLRALSIFSSAPLAAISLVPMHQFLWITVVGAQISFTSIRQIVYPHYIIACTEYQWRRYYWWSWWLHFLRYRSGHTLARIMGSNPAMGVNVCVLCLLCVLQVKVFASGLILVYKGAISRLYLVQISGLWVHMGTLKHMLLFQLQRCSLLEWLWQNWCIKQLQLHSATHTLLERGAV